MGAGIIPPDGKPSMAGAVESWITIVVLTNTRIQILFAALLLRLIVQAQCPVDALKVNGRVESASSESKVRVQLVYPRNRPGESGEVSVQDGKFQIPIEFVTAESSLFPKLPKKCGRKPTTVVVTLLENGEESDQVTLNFARAFKMTDASAYGLRSDLVLKGRPRAFNFICVFWMPQFRVLSFDECLEVVQASRPEYAVLLEPGIDGSKRFWIQLIHTMPPFAMLAYQVSAAKQAQVL
jgi:hypothetical protein